MIEIIKDNEENIKGVIEYYIVDVNGNMLDVGEYCWINECEISPKYRNQGLLKEFVYRITEKYPQLKYGYFWRKRKYGDRIKMYSRKKWLNITRR